MQQTLNIRETCPRNDAPKYLRRPLAVACVAIGVGFAAGGLPSARAEAVFHAVHAGMLQVSQIPGFSGGDQNTNCQVSLTLGVNDFGFSEFNRADYNVKIGTTVSNDVTDGVLISSVTQDGRNNYGTNFYPLSSVATNSTGGYRIVSHAPTNQEYNVHVAGAWFNYAKWLGGYARNSTDTSGGAWDVFNSSPSLVLGTHLVSLGGGRGIVNLTNLNIDARTDGVLLVNHGRDEANFALSRVNTTNGTWNVFVHDHVADGRSYEQDPLAFVFVPKTNIMVVSGRFLGDGSIDMFSGATPQFTVTNLSAGRYDLRMTGYSPTNGVLIISADGDDSLNVDNAVSYEINGDNTGWEIQSRDLPGYILQSPGATEAVASFVFIPAPTPGFTVTPTNNLLTTESGGTNTFTVVLHAPPTANVTIGVSSSDLTEGTVFPASLTFTSTDWDTPQTVTVTGQDDALADGPIAYTIVLAPATSADSRYNGLNPGDVSVINADNEAGVTVSATSLTTAEAGGTNTFTVVLNTPPAASVGIGLSSSDLTEGTVSPASLTFTTGSWNTPQTVTVTGVNDFVDDGDVAYTIITAPTASADPNYNNLNPADVAVINTDDDAAGVTFSTTNLVVSETGSATNFTVVLTSEPTADVIINLASGDATEGAVSPATRTFTSVNWSTPQSVTLTGVDDFINDGDISYTINVTSTTADPLYAGFGSAIAATTLDNEAALTLPSGTTIYGIGTSPLGLDGRATVVDPDTADYNSGSLTATITANGTADDRLAVRHTGNSAGEIGVSGANISYGGTTIGTVAGGVGSTPLVVTFNSAATPAAAEALVRSVTFQNVNSAPSLALRTVTMVLADGDGGTSSASKNVKVGLLRRSDFQQGADHGYGVYAGAADTELWRLAPDPNIPYPIGSTLNGMVVSWSGGFADKSVLLRFDNFIGNGSGQIPTNAIIVSAELILNVADTGRGSPLHRMLIPWNADTDVYNTFNFDGIQTDDNEAVSAFDSQIGVVDQSGLTGTGECSVGVIPDVQAWLAGATNYGWVMPGWNQNNNAIIVRPSEATNIAERPRLRVTWVPAGTAVASFRQGVNGYANAFDTQLIQSTPTITSHTDTQVNVDKQALVTLNEIQALVRFDNLIGPATNQIPSGARIDAAALDLASVGSTAPGAGGNFHALLQPWVDSTCTWNSWVSGIAVNGVEAAVTASIVAGNSSLNPNVQGGYNSFDATTDVQAWTDGVRPNYGWGVLGWPGGNDGWGFSTAESSAAKDRPQLRVYYTPVAGSIVLLSPIKSPTSVQVRFTASAGTYSVLRAPAVTGPWTTNGTATVGVSGIGTNIDNTPLPGAAFYRVKYP